MNKTFILLSHERKTSEGKTFYIYKTEGKNGKIINVKFTRVCRPPMTSGKFQMTADENLVNISTKNKIYNGNEYTEVTLWVNDEKATFTPIDSTVRGVALNEYF